MERLRLWLVRKLPAGLLFHPAEWALAVLVIVPGVLTVAGWRTSDSLAAALPWPVYKAWGVLMVVGGAALIAGLSSIKRAGSRYVVGRVPAYRLGLRLIGATEALYAVCLLASVGVGALQAAVSLLTVSVLCGIKLLTLGGRH